MYDGLSARYSIINNDFIAIIDGPRVLGLYDEKRPVEIIINLRNSPANICVIMQISYQQVIYNIIML